MNRPVTRRRFLEASAGGAFGLALGGIRPDPDALRPKRPHFAPRAKRVILLFLPGGVSHVDTFDPKPELSRRAGTRWGKSKLLAPGWKFHARSECGTLVSDLFPAVGACMDHLCVIRSMHTGHGNHFEACLGMHTGSFSFTRPSLGAWVSWALGSENPRLPAHVVLAPQLPYAGGQLWSADFLPACHQGVRIVPGKNPIPNLRPPQMPRLQRLELDLLRERNREHLARHGDDPTLAARLQCFETARGMQEAAPEVFDFSREGDETRALYGLAPGRTDFAWQALVARRLVERGVRFVELFDVGASRNWDAHADMRSHAALAKKIDRPIAGLLRDLERRGLLDETLVVWATEFGRTPWHDKSPKGRSHHPRVFSCWLAGGGVRGGTTYGESDEVGATIANRGVHVHDLHATILHLLGFDHERLTYRHAGRDFRLTDVHGRVVHELLA